LKIQIGRHSIITTGQCVGCVYCGRSNGLPFNNSRGACTRGEEWDKRGVI